MPSLALGSSEVTLLELVRAYGVFATGGDLARTTAVIGRAALGSDRPLAEPPRLDRVAEPAETYLVTSALEGVVTRGTARSLDPGGRLGPIAGKTGTSNDWRDAWFVAYNPTIVVGVWVGYDDGRSLRMSGATAAVPIAARFLGLALDDAEAEPFRVPEGVEVARVGGGSSWFWDCGGEEVFLEGTAP
ncbi:MAG: penicillin-binding transpeptidase domain-containing protein [Gemmatimonadales bacterium]